MVIKVKILTQTTKAKKGMASRQWETHKLPITTMKKAAQYLIQDNNNQRKHLTNHIQNRFQDHIQR